MIKKAERPPGKILSMGLLVNWALPGTGPGTMFDRVCELAGAAEQCGFDALFVPDHFTQVFPGGPTDLPVLEAYTVLAGVAARTNSLLLGTLVTGVTHRNPAVLAKQVTTLDVVSKGRAVLGIGAAWNVVEHAAYGLPFPPAGERLDLLSDAVQICRSMFTTSRTTLTGARVAVADAMNIPQPVRPGGPPILIGGSGERRTLRLVAEYADISNTTGPPENQRRLLDILDHHCEEVGRDPASITRTAVRSIALDGEGDDRAITSRAGEPDFGDFTITGDADAVREGVNRYLDAGIDSIIVSLPEAHRTADHVRAIGEVLAPLLVGAEAAH